MPRSGQSHKLTTILALDMAGYSAQTELNEAKATSAVSALHAVVHEIASDHEGRIFNTAGDGFMLELPSCSAAVEAAAELARRCHPKVRIGVHVGDAIAQPSGDLLGHGVNVAARLMAQAMPGTALVSAEVRRMIRGPLGERLTSPRVVRLDKMRESVEAFLLIPDAEAHLEEDPAPALPLAHSHFATAGEKDRLNIPALIRFASWAFLNPPRDLRVSFAAMLRIAHAGRYLLIRNLHRPEVFGPIGGVYKFYRASDALLDSMRFRVEGTPTPDDSVDDIRGYLPCGSALRFKRWFDRCVDREDPRTCIHRELAEEIGEIGLSRSLAVPRVLPLRKIRRVEEGPHLPVGKPYFQYRIFDVYEPISASSVETLQFFELLIDMAKGHKHLELVTAEEIKMGRSVSGRVLGHHSAYVFGSKAFRDDAPLYQERGIDSVRR
jgi:class 3 adenylate cyclase